MASEEGTTLRVSLTVGQTSFEAEGPSAEVRELYEQFRDGVADQVAAAAAKTEETPPPADDPDRNPDPPSGTPDSVSGPLVEEAKRLPIKAFLRNFSPNNNKEKAGLLTFWLQHHEGAHPVSFQDIETAWKKTSWKVPGNVSRDVRVAETEGYVSSFGDDDDGFVVEEYGVSLISQLRTEAT